MAPIVPLSSAFTLAVTHWFRSFLGGLVGLAVLIPLLNLVYVVDRYRNSLPTNNIYYDSGNVVVNWLLGSVFFIFCVTIFLGIPAFMAGLLRVWPMKLLFARQVLRPETPQGGRFLLGTALISELSVLPFVLVALSSPDNIGPVAWGVACSVLSLPWLLSSLWVGHRMVREAAARRAVGEAVAV